MTKFETICCEAAKLFARSSVDTVSMRDVADACGITSAALYYHFESKEVLYEEVVNLAFDDFMSRLEQARMALPPEREKPSEVMGLVYDVVLAEPTLFVLMQRDLHRCDQGARLLKSRKKFARAQSFLEETLTKYHGLEEDPEEALAMACIVTGYCEFVHADPRAYGPERETFIAKQRLSLLTIAQRTFD